MASFALISEGITDQILLEALILSWCGKDSVVNLIQPMRDATDQSRQQGYGGWERVLEYCTEEEFEWILSANDYIVVHLDSDIGEHPKLAVPLTENGEERPVADIVKDMLGKVIQQLGAYYEQCKGRILFAIAVHSIDCWLLPLYAKNKADFERIQNCAHHLARLNKFADKEELKTFEKFRSLVAPLEKSRKNKEWEKNINRCREYNESLAIFLDSLPRASD